MCVHTHTHTHVHTLSLLSLTYMYSYTHTPLSHVCACAHTHTLSCMCVHTHILSLLSLIYVCSYTHTSLSHVCAHIHTHTQRVWGNVAQWPNTFQGLGLIPTTEKTKSNPYLLALLLSNSPQVSCLQLIEVSEHSLGPTVPLWTTLYREQSTRARHNPVFFLPGMWLHEGQPWVPSSLWRESLGITHV